MKTPKFQVNQIQSRSLYQPSSNRTQHSSIRLFNCHALSKWISATALLSSSIAAFGAAQPISGIDISAKKNPGGVKSSLNIGGGGPGSLTIGDDFFFPGFSTGARFTTAETLYGNGALAGGAIMSLERLTEPDFGMTVPIYAVAANILSLSVASDTPLYIDASHSYNWLYTMESTTTGQLNITNETSLGGKIASSMFAISYHVEFSQVGGSGGPLTINGFDTLSFEGTPDWSNQFPDGSTPPGGSNFVLGSDGTSIAGATISSSTGIFSSNIQAIPEPSAIILGGLSILGIVIRRKR